MKLLGKLSTILFITLISFLPQRIYANTSQGDFFKVQPKYEVRAVWLTTLGGLDWPKCYANSASSINRQKQELSAILDRLKDANINTVLFQARVRGTVIYPSAIEPWDECCSGVPGRSPGYDPLAYAVEECHKRGMEIQAWVVAIPVGKWNALGCRTLRRKYPQLVIKNGKEGYINPANPMAAKYIADICREITKNYDVDGIHLDYIRYPETWNVRISQDKARMNITNIVQSVYNTVKNTKPWVKLSCAPIGKYSDLPRYSSNGWNAFTKGCQDAQGWLRMGLMDQLYPMMYFKGNQFYPFALDWHENSCNRTIVPGLGIYFLSQSEGNWPVNEVFRQMYVARKECMGYALFRNKFFCDDIKGLYTFTKDKFNLYPALVPPIYNPNKTKPTPPRNIKKIKTNSGEVITWDVTNDNGNGGITYNIYASRTYPVDINNASNLIAPRKRGNCFAITDDEGLYYAVTSMDRYGQESTPLQQDIQMDENVSPEKYIRNNGSKMILPEKRSNMDADYILIKSIPGTIIATLPYKGKYADISRIPEGCYMVYSLNSKEIVHRLGFLFIKR